MFGVAAVKPFCLTSGTNMCDEGFSRAFDYIHSFLLSSTVESSVRSGKSSD